jgi:hypothetical protein
VLKIRWQRVSPPHNALRKIGFSRSRPSCARMDRLAIGPQDAILPHNAS